MELIKSFKKNHNKLEPGVHACGVNRDMVTYDLRFCKPNVESMSPEALHSIEHLLATYFKSVSKYSEYVISFCPEGCRTGFYLELWSDYPFSLYSELIKSINWSISQKSVPGSKKIQCGNYREHDLKGAIEWLTKYKSLLSKSLVLKAEIENSISLSSLAKRYHIKLSELCLIS